jgi:hypothetical protein
MSGCLDCIGAASSGLKFEFVRTFKNAHFTHSLSDSQLHSSRFTFPPFSLAIIFGCRKCLWVWRYHKKNRQLEAHVSIDEISNKASRCWEPRNGMPNRLHRHRDPFYSSKWQHDIVFGFYDVYQEIGVIDYNVRY